MSTNEISMGPDAGLSGLSAEEARMARTLRETFASGGDLAFDLRERIRAQIRSAQAADTAPTAYKESKPMKPAIVEPAEHATASTAPRNSAWRAWIALAACIALAALLLHTYSTRPNRTSNHGAVGIAPKPAAEASVRRQAAAFITLHAAGTAPKSAESFEAERRTLDLALANDASPEAGQLRAQLAALMHPSSGTAKPAPDLAESEIDQKAARAREYERANESVQRALRWLEGAQETDGRFDCAKHGGIKGQDTATTALAVLSCMGAGHTSKMGMYKGTVAKGVTWLIDHGHAPDVTQAALRTLVLCENFGMSAEHRAAAESAMQGLLALQGTGGGWLEAGPNDGRGNRLDPTVWALTALKSAKIVGLKPPPDAIRRAVQFLEEKEAEGILKTNDAEVAAGVGAARYFSSANPVDDRTIERLAGTAARNLPTWNDEGLGDEVISWYHTTLLTFSQGGTAWSRWNGALKATLLDHQNTETHPGSWNYRDVSAPFRWGRVGTTGLATLSLEVYCRYLPGMPTDAAPAPKVKPRSSVAPQDF